MPTATTASPKASRPRAKATAKRSGAAKATKASKAGTTQAKAAHAKGARTRAAHQAESTVRQAQTATRETAEVLGDYAERAVLIPVGAALLARDRVVESVTDTLSTYSSPSKTQAQLRRFERRANTARSRFEREVRKARVRVERELRQRRRKLESTVNGTVSDLEERRDAIAKGGSDLAKEVQERILSLV
ncbi:MAG TPA: hypothetical protein VL979_15225 [Solirubrobacteraceae bacterium]|nr:hypothetical protein [Solirubrobacteraceae bacterium]